MMLIRRETRVRRASSGDKPSSGWPGLGLAAPALVIGFDDVTQHVTKPLVAESDPLGLGWSFGCLSTVIRLV